jgi:hypothetical protein
MQLTRAKRVSTVKEEFRAGMETQLEELVRIGDTLDRDRNDLRLNRELSVEGQSAADRRIARAALDKVTALDEKTVGVLRTRIASMAARLANVDFRRPTDPGERIAYEIRLGEIRDEVRERKPMERTLIYMRATDPLVLDALESAPPVLPEEGYMLIPFVDPERVRARRAERARASNPELAKEMSDLEDLASAYEALIESIRRSIHEQVEGIIDTNEMERQRASITRATVGAK